ncbi:MAG: ABC transporter permease [Candidatus Cellulosilyticum pullistercoris]|uniref:ABC transporter permease n=1 Tax=Candidatus Cellulosilyticum pullistercoris TaxID=2838521 RepID=A0A9E2NK11_9FIRM|nr:ABC transporter permease [Candidatus Cellulosilyticum pullistercoris]
MLIVMILVMIGVISLMAPYIAWNDPYNIDLTNILQSPSKVFPFGTDALGRCVFSRVLYGAKNTIFSALIVVAITFTLGSLIGIVSGYVGGTLDHVVMRIVDIFLAFPGMVLAIAVAGILGGGLMNAMLAIIAIGWTKYTRIARSYVLEIKEETFIQAARLSGKGSFYIIMRHIIPNMLGYMIVTASLDIGTTMIEMSSLAFLGLSSPLPSPEWGAMMSEGKSMIQFAPWVILGPGVALVVVVILFNLLGDTIRDLLDEKQKRRAV